MPSLHTRQVLDEVSTERLRQEKKLGIENYEPGEWVTVLAGETGDMAKAVWEDRILDYRREMISVAATAVAAIESLDRALIEHRIGE